MFTESLESRLYFTQLNLGSVFDRTEANLSVARAGIAAAATNDVAVFAGGDNFGELDAVDIYNATTKEWRASHLSIPRVLPAAAGLESKILFAGGGSIGFSNFDAVDIYDTATAIWSTAKPAITVNNTTLFAGGDTSKFFSTVDVFLPIRPATK